MSPLPQAIRVTPCLELSKITTVVRRVVADCLNAATKYVATHRPESLDWGPFEGFGPDIVEGIRRIKSQDGRDLIVSGSSTLTSTVLEHGLADEVVLIVS
jgi:dihydrofolate reductase